MTLERIVWYAFCAGLGLFIGWALATLFFNRQKIRARRPDNFDSLWRHGLVDLHLLGPGTEQMPSHSVRFVSNREGHFDIEKPIEYPVAMRAMTVIGVGIERSDGSPWFAMQLGPYTVPAGSSFTLANARVHLLEADGGQKMMPADLVEPFLARLEKR